VIELAKQGFLSFMWIGCIQSVYISSNKPKYHDFLDGQPEDIGWAAVFWASEAARDVTGISLPVDGGNSIGF
jgi:NAD(P)-dependent dehydrogenase (short-subunit alcohol dehydrogenase family)